MIIKNYSRLATSPLRKAALDIVETGLEALQTPEIMRRSVSLEESGSRLKVRDAEIDLSPFTRIFVVGFGKAAVAMGKILEEVLGDRITTGFILDRRPGTYKKLRSLVVTHPDPTPQNVKATEEVINLLKKADSKTFVIILISGGGSAMLTAPDKITVEEKAFLARRLMDSGATIEEINIARKHLSKIKGGHLVEFAYPAKILTLILSDVPSDDLSIIASGPTVLDNSTNKEAKAVLIKYGITDRIDFSETPKDPHLFEHVENVVIGNVGLAIGPMEKKAQELGFKPLFLTTTFTGNADSAGKMLLKMVKPGEALMAAGETTVKVQGKGVGGRNQQLVLSALPHIKEGQLLLSVNTDGTDNSDAAGALGDTETINKAKAKKLDAVKYAAMNDSYTFFKETGNQIITGELESNYADIMLCLSER